MQRHTAAEDLSSSTPLPKTPAAWPTHHTEQSPFVEGRMESDELGLGSWLPLDNTTRERRKGKQATRGRCSGVWIWCAKAGEEPRPNGLPSTYQGSNSNTGLFRVRKRRTTGLPSWTRGFPRRNGFRDRKDLWRLNPRAGRRRTSARAWRQ